jgi:hypothetical protein
MTLNAGNFIVRLIRFDELPFSALTSALCLCYKLCFWEADPGSRGQSRSKSRGTCGGGEHRSTRMRGREDANRITIGISTPTLPRPATCGGGLPSRPRHSPRGGGVAHASCLPHLQRCAGRRVFFAVPHATRGLCPVEGAARLRRAMLWDVDAAFKDTHALNQSINAL